MNIHRFLPVFWLAGMLSAQNPGKKAPELSPVDRYIADSEARAARVEDRTPGSLWRPGAALEFLGRDLRAYAIDDLLTILVAENADAVRSGTVDTQRNSSARASVDAFGGRLNPGGALTNLAGASSAVRLDGRGSTARQTVLTTSLSARVTHVLANGYLVVEGKKRVVVNSENQLVTVRGVVRPVDIGFDNTVPSARLAEMEVSVAGRGVVNDAIRRPNFLYRLLLGILPF
jgi:flagellar L-ring protein precursor FlgH